MKNVNVEISIGPDIPKSDWRVVLDGVDYKSKADYVLIEITPFGTKLVIGQPSQKALVHLSGDLEAGR